MAFDFVLAVNSADLSGTVTGTALGYPAHMLHGLFINQVDSADSSLFSTIEVWAQAPDGSGYVPIVQQGNLNTDTWFTAIGGSGAGPGDYQKYLSFGDVNTTSTNSAGGPLLLPYYDGGKFRLKVNPTNGTNEDTLVIVALLSDGLS